MMAHHYESQCCLACIVGVKRWSISPYVAKILWPPIGRTANTVLCHLISVHMNAYLLFITASDESNATKISTSHGHIQ